MSAVYRYSIPVEIFQHIASDKDLRKIFIIFLTFRSTTKFPAKKISSKELARIAFSCKKSIRTIYHYLKIAQCYGMIFRKNGGFHILEEEEFYLTLKFYYNKELLLSFDFDSENPLFSINFAQVTYFLKNQEKAIKAKLRSRNGKSITKKEYEDFLSHLQTHEYSNDMKFLPPVLTLKSIQKLLGYKSKSSALYLKRKLVSTSKIKVFSMKKPRSPSTKEKIKPAMLNPPHFAQII